MSAKVRRVEIFYQNSSSNLAITYIFYFILIAVWAKAIKRLVIAIGYVQAHLDTIKRYLLPPLHKPFQHF